MRNKLKSAAAILAAAMLTHVAVYADGPPEVSIAPMQMNLNADNSNLQVEVIKQSGGTKTTIFTGKLADYDNGAWVNIDFSKADLAILYDWGEILSEPIYIVPVRSGTNQTASADTGTANAGDVLDTGGADSSTNAADADNTVGTADADDTADTGSADDTADTVGTDDDGNTADTVGTGEVNTEEFIYRYGLFDAEIENAQNEKTNVLKDGTVLRAVTLLKNPDDTAPAAIYAAVYDDGRLKDVRKININSVHGNGEYTAYNLNIPLDNVTPNTKIKIMVWDGNDFMPNAICMDLYYNYRINLQTAINQLYTFPIISTGNADKFKVEFDTEWFEKVDLCKETDAEDILPGNVSENITIDEVTDSGFTFTYTGTQPEKCVNKIVLRAKKTGITHISVEEISD